MAHILELSRCPFSSQFFDPNVFETKFEFVAGVELQANHTFDACIVFSV